jgi:uncharacterized protein YjiS (DUF1127 family)
MSMPKPLIALRLWLSYRSNRRALSRLNDRMLQDIGLSRSGIGYAASVQTAQVWNPPWNTTWER